MPDVVKLFKRVRRAAVDAMVPRSFFMLRGRRDARKVALTFDDGPFETTAGYLEVLARHGARATFFLVGERCLKRPDDVAAIAAGGHELGGHGYTHTPFPKLSSRALVSELERTAALLPPPARGRPLVRPPHGIFNLRALVTCARAGYTTVLWSLDTLDYRERRADELAAVMAPERVEPGEVVLLHEGKSWTREALGTTLERLRGAGIETVTISELLAPA